MSDWNIIIPIGLSAIAILLTMLRDFLIPFVFKPKILIEANNKECVEETNEPYRLKSKVHSGHARWLHLKLINKKGFFSRSARNCYVKLFEIRNSQNERVSPFSPILLKWGTYENYKNDLAIGEYHLIDFVHESPFLRVIQIQGPIPKGLREKLMPGKYTLKIGVFGDNFGPIFKAFKIELTDKFGELKFI